MEDSKALFQLLAAQTNDEIGDVNSLQVIQLGILLHMHGIMSTEDSIKEILVKMEREYCSKITLMEFELFFEMYRETFHRVAEISEAFYVLRDADQPDATITSSSLMAAFLNNDVHDVSLEDCKRIIKLTGGQELEFNAFKSFMVSQIE